MSITKERAKYHQLLHEIQCYIPKNGLVYDIGKSRTHDYRSYFKDYGYKTIDNNSSLCPDYVVDMGQGVDIEQSDLVLCNGVTEQCENPFEVIKGIYQTLKPNGYALFGICSTGYPVYDTDYTRFTLKGVKNLLKDFKLIKTYPIYRDKEISYVYVIAKKEDKDE